MTNDRYELSTAVMRGADAYARLRIDGAARDLIAFHPPLADSVEFGHWLAQTGFAAGDALVALADAIEGKVAETISAFVEGVLIEAAAMLADAGFETHAAAAELAAGATEGLSAEGQRCIARGVYSRLRTMAERHGATLH